MTLQTFGNLFRIGVAAAILANQHKLNMKVSEAIQQVKDMRDQLIKAKGEILGKLARLENADGELSEEQTAALVDLRATIQGVDDIIADDPSAPGAPLTEEEKKTPAKGDKAPTPEDKDKDKAPKGSPTSKD